MFYKFLRFWTDQGTFSFDREETDSVDQSDREPKFPYK